MNKHIIALIKLLLLEERPYYSLEMRRTMLMESMGV